MVGSPEETRFTLADIPGLIEGANEGKGLGHDFLRHIERCSVLLLVIDTAGVDGRDPAEDYRLLRKELRLHDAALGKRPFLVAANKVDLPESEKNLAALRAAARRSIFPISTKSGEGLPALLHAVRQSLPA